jgi:hypothetical protein
LQMKLANPIVKSSKINSRCKVHGTSCMLHGLRYTVQGARKTSRFFWFSVHPGPCTLYLPLTQKAEGHKMLTIKDR